MSLSKTTFEAIYGPGNVDDSPGKSGLEEWYDSVWSVSFSQFSVADIARACRQNLALEHIIPRAFAILRDNPMAGEMFAGELYYSISSVERDFWYKNPAYREELIKIFTEQERDLAAQYKQLHDEEGQDFEDFHRLQELIGSLKLA